MKNLLFALSILTIFALSSCGDTSKKDMKDANDNMRSVDQKLENAAVDASDEVQLKAKSDWKKFKAESDSEIVAMKGQTTRFKDQIEKNLLRIM